MHMSKLITLYALNVFSLLSIHSLDKVVLNKKEEEGEEEEARQGMMIRKGRPSFLKD